MDQYHKSSKKGLKTQKKRKKKSKKRYFRSGLNYEVTRRPPNFYRLDVNFF